MENGTFLKPMNRMTEPKEERNYVEKHVHI